MELSDVSSASHGERSRQFLTNVFGKTGASKDLTFAELKMADNMATTEMLDEIHCMLRALLKIE